MNNVEILEQVGILDDVRERLGASDENDTSFDHKIERMNPEQMVAKWSGWELGDESWGTTIIDYYKQIIEIKAETSTMMTLTEILQDVQDKKMSVDASRLLINARFQING